VSLLSKTGQSTTKACLALAFFFFLTLQALPQDSPVSHTLFLIGDCGEPYVTGDPIGDVLRKKVTEAGANVTVLYLGDNVYPKGLPFEGERLREPGEAALANQVKWVSGLPAKAFFIPGNHDWHHWGRKGLQYVLNQQRWIDSLKVDHIAIAPRDGCPGPVEIMLDDKNVLVILDTQWLLHQWEKPGEESGCDAKTTADVLSLLHDIFERHKSKRIIIAAHHPLITYGEHGGVFPLKAHIFPLEELTDYLYVPLPLVGSIYPLYRKWFGHIQDTAHPTYRQFSEAIQDIMAQHPGSIYAAGHEHGLQYILKDSSHLIVSGSGAKTEHLRKKGHAIFARDVRGFATAQLHANGTVSLVFFQVDEKNPDGTEVFRKHLPAAKPEPTAYSSSQDLKQESVLVNASDQYEAGNTKEFFLGANYRRSWSEKIRVPVFDIGTEKGGLKVTQRGGGMQTLSLRLEDRSGQEYVLRSVEKYPEHAVPEVLRKTFAQDLVQDQISAAHPYAALVIPALAEAAGIYHTNPKLVYIPDDSRFGDYRKIFANSLALFEERPAGNWSEAPYFGNSEKIVNTGKVLEKLADDNDNQVDQRFVLRSRLFDLLIGDWDRHDDQWRWATLKEKKGDVFRPIPRDRDQAFFVNEGILSKLWSRKWALPKFEGFDKEINWPSGLSFNARYFDRTFLTELSLEDWIASAHELQQALTDEKIEDAIKQWPVEIFNNDGQRVITALKARRDHLVKYAESHYGFLAKEVDIPGSDKREHFEIERLGNGDVAVRVFKINKEGEAGKELYQRLFKSSETREIRLFGLGGDDRFEIKGGARKSVVVRVIGGAGSDTLYDKSTVNALRKTTIFYDQKGQGAFLGTPNIKDRRSDDTEVNEYDRKSFQYPRLAPLVYGNYNLDDGVFIGGGFLAINHGFRKKPFRQRHIFLASAAPLTRSFNFRYQGLFTEVIGKWDFDVDLNVKSPNYVNNFFGLGNETAFKKDIADVDNPINYYRFRFEELLVDAGVVRKFSNWGTFKVGAAFQRIEMEEPEPGERRFIFENLDLLPEGLIDEYQSYGGVTWHFGIDKRNNPKFTSRGVTWDLTGKNMEGLIKDAEPFSSYESSIAFYYRFRVPQRLMFALRAGGGVTTGNYQFYQAQILDGKTELRGFRKTRFYGDSKFYNNTEVRLTLTSFRSYLFPATMGILAFHDVGRVWYSDENGNDPSSESGQSKQWHSGWGGGLWFTPFNTAVLSLEAGHSAEGTLIYLRLGFLF
jgi:hypothetical protein